MLDWRAGAMPGGASQAGVGQGEGGGVPYLRGAPGGEALIGDGRGGRLVGGGAGASAVLLQSRCLRRQTGQDARRALGLAQPPGEAPTPQVSRIPGHLQEGT